MIKEEKNFMHQISMEKVYMLRESREKIIKKQLNESKMDEK